MNRFVNCCKVFALALITVGTVPAYADTKTFAYAYPARTIGAEELEMEHYLDVGVNDWDNPETEKRERDWGAVDWKHQVEFEYGLTDALEFGLYQVFSQKPFGQLANTGKYRGHCSLFPRDPPKYRGHCSLFPRDPPKYRGRCSLFPRDPPKYRGRCSLFPRDPPVSRCSNFAQQRYGPVDFRFSEFQSRLQK